MDAKEQARNFHQELVASMRRRNAKERDVEDPDEFEALMVVTEELGQVAERAAAKAVKPELVGRAMQFYAKCIGVALVKPSMVPEATDG